MENNFVPELNDNFRWWFRDSKVVDDNGQPLVCYHGSTVDIEEFDIGYSGQNTGNNQEEVFYFTSDRHTAITYSQEATVRENEWRFYDEETGFDNWDDYAEHLRNEVFDNPHINPCYLRIENPYVFDAEYTDFDYKRNYTLCSLLKGNSNIDYDMWDEGLAEELYDVFTEYDEENDEYIEKNVSFDGIIIKNVIDSISEDANYYIDVYVVWDSRQIKSVFNKGIWDLDNPNVNEGFNTKTTGMSYYDDLLNDPKYSEKKRKFGEVIKISPRTYIETCVEGFNTNKKLGMDAEQTTFEKLVESRRDKKLEKIKANFYKTDYDMPILHYEYKNENYISFGQEGLHRAIAAMDLGEKEIPVLLTVSLDYKADDGIEDVDLKLFLKHLIKRLTKGGKMDEKLKKTIIKPKNVVLDDMEDETGMNTLDEEGASFAQLGTAPTPTAGQPTINGQPVQGKSVKKSKNKSKVSELIEKFQKLI